MMNIVSLGSYPEERPTPGWVVGLAFTVGEVSGPIVGEGDAAVAGVAGGWGAAGGLGEDAGEGVAVGRGGGNLRVVLGEEPQATETAATASRRATQANRDFLMRENIVSLY